MQQAGGTDGGRLGDARWREVSRKTMLAVDGAPECSGRWPAGDQQVPRSSGRRPVLSDPPFEATSPAESDDAEPHPREKPLLGCQGASMAGLHEEDRSASTGAKRRSTRRAFQDDSGRFRKRHVAGEPAAAVLAKVPTATQEEG